MGGGLEKRTRLGLTSTGLTAPWGPSPGTLPDLPATRAVDVLWVRQVPTACVGGVRHGLSLLSPEPAAVVSG